MKRLWKRWWPVCPMIICGNLEHARVLAKASGCFYNPESNVVISREKDGVLLGGVIYQGYNGASVVIQVASFDPHWLDRDMLWMAFHYPFEQLGVQKLFTQTPSNNLKALDFNRKLGFKDEARIAGVFRDADLVIRSMRREECRWLKRGSRRGIFLEGRSTARTGYERCDQRGQGSDGDGQRHGQGDIRLGD